jgi:peptidoglycan/LPS O-acetylase OafA/YrhL
LDGLRGLAALYVVVFHSWLYSFEHFPRNTGPAWLTWAMYGRLAVVFFLVLSGFSLAVPAARNGWRLGGATRFLRRRAWRILPPYWAALVLSVGVSWALVRASRFGPPGPESVLVHALLLQDVVWTPTPNGAFWSIAVEAELYLVFPLLLLLRRRFGALVTLAAVAGPVVVLGLVDGNPAQGRTGLTWQLAPLFALGLVSAGVLVAPERVRRLPWHRLALLVAAPVIALIAWRGPVWTVTHYFWLDLALAPAMAMLVAAVATGRPAGLVRLLDSGPLQSLGRCSYSLYLIHLPVVMVVNRRLIAPFVHADLPAFGLTLLVGVPACLASAWVFAQVFELPFQRHRSWAAVRAAIRTGPAVTGREPPAIARTPPRPRATRGRRSASGRGRRTPAGRSRPRSAGTA